MRFHKQPLDIGERLLSPRPAQTRGVVSAVQPSKITETARAAFNCCKKSLPRPTVLSLKSRRLLLLSATAFGASLLVRNRVIDSSLNAQAMSFTRQELLTRQLQEEGLLKTPRIAAAFGKVDRLAYCSGLQAEDAAYVDTPLPIGFGQTISAPHMHATCLELLEQHLQPGARVLDVGSGSGFLTAAMGLLVAPEGRVVGVETVEALAHRSKKSIQEDQPQLVSEGVVTILAGNALGDIISSRLRFDAIHVGAAAASMPESLKAKLANGGRLVVPVNVPGSHMQVLKQVDKSADGQSYTTTELMGVGYVPLIPPEQ